jgi:hypothetical protein
MDETTEIYHMEEGGLFGLFVCHVEISQITVPLAALLTYPWKSPQQVGYNEGDFEIFRLKVILNFQLFLSLQFQFNYKNGFVRKNYLGNQFRLWANSTG